MGSKTDTCLFGFHSKGLTNLYICYPNWICHKAWAQYYLVGVLGAKLHMMNSPGSNPCLIIACLLGHAFKSLK